MRISHLLSTAAPQDAAPTVAITLAALLRPLGFAGTIHAATVHKTTAPLIQPLQSWSAQERDVALLHYDGPSSLVSFVAHQKCRFGIVYYGTPVAAAAPTTAHLGLLSRRAEFAFGLTPRLCRQLEDVGFTNVRLLPFPLDAARYDIDRRDAPLHRRLRGQRPLFIASGSWHAEERLADVLALHDQLSMLHPKARLLIVQRSDSRAAIATTRRMLRKRTRVHFLKHLSHSQLIAAYRAADALISMSEHSVFVPTALEAMASDVPVVGFASPLLTDTLAGHGLVFDVKLMAGVAETLLEFVRHDDWRRAVVDGQRRALTHHDLPVVQTLLRETFVGQRDHRPSTRRTSHPRIAIVWPRPHSAAPQRFPLLPLVSQLAQRSDVHVLHAAARDENIAAIERPAALAWRTTVFRSTTTSDRARRPIQPGPPATLLAEETLISRDSECCDGLLNHLADSGSEYDAVLFFDYRSARTAWGVPLVAARAVVTPLALDEPALRFSAYSACFEAPRAVMCTSPDEQALLGALFPRVTTLRLLPPIAGERPEDVASSVADAYMEEISRIRASSP